LPERAIELAIRDRITLVAEIGLGHVAMTGVVANLQPGEVWLCVSSDAAVQLPLITKVRLVLATPSGRPVTAQSEVIRIVGAGGRVVALTKPDSWNADARRGNSRVPIALPAYLRREGCEGPAAARTTNISVGSFQCLTGLAVEVGERVRTTLMLSPTTPFECMAQVVRLDSDPAASAGSKTLVAFRFLALTDGEQAQIAAAVAALDADEPAESAEQA
jgi:PilZ domain